jgi:pentatricopeptide repeat protein
VRIAILHEMLIKLGWAEKVVENWCKIYPEADIFTLIYDGEKVWKIFPENKINKQVFDLTTQKIYKYTKKQRLCLAHMAISVEQLDFSEYDTVLCSSSWFAHGAITKPETKFIVYCHSPTRYMWDWTNEYKRDLWLNSGIKKWLFSYILNRLFLKLRQWDYIASKRADITLANSSNTRQRITKYYRKDTEILYPPVETKRFWSIWATLPLTTKIQDIPESYYIIISALTEFKKIEVAIEWFNKMPKQKLVIIWKWDYEKTLKKHASENIIFSWAKYWDELVFLVQNSLGLIFPGEEDFWIVPVEVMAAGKPVFAYKWWWLLETVIAWITWEFFDDKNGEDFVENFLNFNRNNLKWKYTKEACKVQAEMFSEIKFEERIKQLVNW